LRRWPSTIGYPHIQCPLALFVLPLALGLIGPVTVDFLRAPLSPDEAVLRTRDIPISTSTRSR
jgi:hypothetical protein